MTTKKSKPVHAEPVAFTEEERAEMMRDYAVVPEVDKEQNDKKLSKEERKARDKDVKEREKRQAEAHHRYDAQTPFDPTKDAEDDAREYPGDEKAEEHPRRLHDRAKDDNRKSSDKKNPKPPANPADNQSELRRAEKAHFEGEQRD